MSGRLRLLVATFALGVSACRPESSGARGRADSAQLSERAAKLQQRLADSASGAERALPVAKWLLPPSLSEISGLALTSDGRILAHGDELGRISVIDPKRGVILKEFRFGARADFEGITIAHDNIYMIDSDGQLYVFKEGPNGARVPYQLLDTRLGRECEFEGVVFDRSREALLLPCKSVEKKSMRGNLVIYVWKLHDLDPPRLSVILIPLARVIADNQWKTLRPTDITVDPNTGNYILVAAHEKALIELSPNGEVVRAMPLPERDQHPQAEGVAITSDGILIIADE
ncbi:MAG: SdiA-regulated domain-containing protein, partial [Gemmatimonadaceae bacterium]